MQPCRYLVAAFALACWMIVAILPAAAQLPLEPPKESGQSVTPAFEGWYPNDDGSFNLLVGYFNRNTKQTLDIPIGPDNRIEPGGPDYGQPTHFLTRRQWGVFVIRVPKDFGNKRLTWTIVSNGKTNSIPIGLIKDYQVEPFKDAAMGNTPPLLSFERGGPTHQGPPRTVAASYSATVGEPFSLTAFITDDRHRDAGEEEPQRARSNFPRNPPVSVVWTKFRGPGDITFSEARPKVDEEGKSTTTATFSAPGEYMIRVQGNDRSGDGGGGFQCCWTNTYVKVTVKPKAVTPGGGRL